MTLTQLFVVLRARWRFALLVLMLVVGLVTVATLLRTPQYTAVASVVLDVKSPDPIAGVILPGMTVPGYMGTQLGVLQSERVALRAVQALHLEADPRWQQRWRDETQGRGELRSWLADELVRKVEVAPARDSNVIMITYRAADPAEAAAVANAVVQAYIDTTLDLRVEPARQYGSVFDGSARRLREDLEKAQTRLSAYQQTNGIVASDEKLDVETLRLTELSSQLVALQGIAAESGQRQDKAAGNAERMPEVLSNPLVVSFATELSRLEQRLKELTANLGDNHPQVIEVRGRIAELRTRIATETQRVTGSLGVNNAVNQARLGQLRAAVDEQRTRMLRLKGQRDESAVLLRDVENARRAYDMVLARATQSVVESQTTQTNVSVLKHATPPGLPSSPKLLLNIAVALGLGALLGLGAALVRESFDRRLRTEADVTRGLRQPLLGVLPSRPRAGTSGRSRLRIAGLLAPRIAAR